MIMKALRDLPLVHFYFMVRCGVFLKHVGFSIAYFVHAGLKVLSASVQIATLNRGLREKKWGDMTSLSLFSLLQTSLKWLKPIYTYAFGHRSGIRKETCDCFHLSFDLD